jgi:hypothetical protein
MYPQIPNLHETNRPVKADGRRDRQTDMTKLKVDFRNFANAPEASTGRAAQVP